MVYFLPFLFIVSTHARFITTRSHLPARATRLLNRSRIQNSTNSHGRTSFAAQPSQHGSDSPHSLDSFSRRTPSRMLDGGIGGVVNGGGDGIGSTSDGSRCESMHSSDDSGLFVLDKLTRSTMLQDVLSFKRQLLQLRSVLQQVCAMRHVS